MTPTTKHCAIYTRKSSDERLELEFNSLDAQREACEAYIISQKSEGWIFSVVWRKILTCKCPRTEGLCAIFSQSVGEG